MLVFSKEIKEKTKDIFAKKSILGINIAGKTSKFESIYITLF